MSGGDTWATAPWLIKRVWRYDDLSARFRGRLVSVAFARALHWSSGDGDTTVTTAQSVAAAFSTDEIPTKERITWLLSNLFQCSRETRGPLIMRRSRTPVVPWTLTFEHSKCEYEHYYCIECADCGHTPSLEDLPHPTEDGFEALVCVIDGAVAARRTLDFTLAARKGKSKSTEPNPTIAGDFFAELELCWSRFIKRTHGGDEFSLDAEDPPPTPLVSWWAARADEAKRANVRWLDALAPSGVQGLHGQVTASAAGCRLLPGV
jgi:hypothetical protein